MVLLRHRSQHVMRRYQNIGETGLQHTYGHGHDLSIYPAGETHNEPRPGILDIYFNY